MSGGMSGGRFTEERDMDASVVTWGLEPSWGEPYEEVGRREVPWWKAIGFDDLERVREEIVSQGRRELEAALRARLLRALCRVLRRIADREAETLIFGS